MPEPIEPKYVLIDTRDRRRLCDILLHIEDQLKALRAAYEQQCVLLERIENALERTKLG